MNYLPQKLEQFERALASFNNGLTAANELERDGAIQRFEFCYELSWKTMKLFLEEKGFADLHSPRSVYKTAFKARLIINEQMWLSMLDQRNLTVHTYDDITAEKIWQNLSGYYSAMLDVLKKMQADI